MKIKSVVLFLLLGACASSEVRQNLTSACRVDTDCAIVNPSCCSCNAGGSQQAVLKELAQTNAQHCAAFPVFCAQYISNDPTCKATGAICQNGQCQLQY